jgi:hypothetical protein
VQYPELSKLQCLNKLFEKLEIIRSAITTSQTNYNLKNQVLTACKKVPKYIFVLYNPGLIYETVCAQLRSFITATTSTQMPVQVYITAISIGKNISEEITR